jgi:hypothetical protein
VDQETRRGIPKQIPSMQQIVCQVDASLSLGGHRLGIGVRRLVSSRVTYFGHGSALKEGFYLPPAVSSKTEATPDKDLGPRP